MEKKRIVCCFSLTLPIIMWRIGLTMVKNALSIQDNLSRMMPLFTNGDIYKTIALGNFLKKIPIKMRKNQFKGVVMAIKRTVLLSTCALPLAQPLHAAEVPDKAPSKVRPFSLPQVKLLNGPFKHAQELNEKYLLSLEPDRLLHTFRLTADLPTSAKPYGGWEDPTCEVRGHAVGHYLSGCALAYQSSGNEKLMERSAQVVAGMAECQAKFPSGYLSAFPEELIDRVVALKPVWVPWYTLHKIYAGLLDQYQLCGNKQALEVLERAIGWVDSRVSQLTDEQMQTMLNCEHGGMNEVLANLYAVTGNAKYLKLAIRFNHHAVLDPAVNGEDRLTGLHANTQIPKFIGMARLYELTGDKSSRKGCEFFWNVVTKERSYVIGGNSDNESFSPKERLSTFLGPNTTETCNTYNMLKLTRQLITWDTKAEYADYYERALYNHMLPQQNPENGMVLYYMPLRPGSERLSRFGTPENTFWCCTGTGMESHSKYGDSVYFHTDSDLYVNLFMATELVWKEKGITVRQETGFPNEHSTKLTISAVKPVKMAINIRYPYWATTDSELKINGAKQNIATKPGSYITLDREWKTGDTIELVMPFRLRFEAFLDDENRAAVIYGPLVMCAWTTKDNPVSVIRGGKNEVLKALQPGTAGPNTFTAPASIFRSSFEKTDGETTFVPFYLEHRKPYTVYWEICDDARWVAKESEMKVEKERQRIIDVRRVDGLEFFDQAERDHNFQGEKTWYGDHNGRRWRHCDPGGWFQYDIKVLSDQQQFFRCSYWGSDTGREFDILVDGRKIATEKLTGEKPNQFFDREYPIPGDLLKGKDKVTVRFQPVAKSQAGGVFGCYVLKEQ